MRIGVLLLVAAGCQDPTVTVRIELPAGPRDYPALVDTVAVTVLQDDTVDCDQLAFGRISADAVSLAQVTGVSFELAEGGAPIGNVPRLGPKLWLAEGRDADGIVLVAGCATQGDIDGDAVVTIPTEPSAAITVDLHVGGDMQLEFHTADEPVPPELRVVIDDGYTDTPEPLPGRAVTWDVFGPRSIDLPGSTEADTGGVATLALDKPAAFGPASIQIRARWARTQPALVPAFGGAASGTTLSINRACTDVNDTLIVETGQWLPFRIGLQGAISGLARDDTRAYLYAASRSGATAIDGCSGDLGAITTYALLRNSLADPVDRLLIMTATQWIEHEVTAGATTLTVAPRAPIAWSNPTADAPVAILTMRACAQDLGDDDYVLAQLSNNTVIAFDVTGAPIAAHPLATRLTAVLQAAGTRVPRLSQSGCIAQGEGEDRVAALILETPRVIEVPTPPRVLVLDTDGYPALETPSFGEVAFTPVAAGDEPLLLGGVLDPSGAKVVRWRLTTGANGLELREDWRDDSLGAPASIALGYIDGDDELDTVWGLIDTVQGGIPDARLQMAFGCGAGDLALNGISPSIASISAAVFLSPAGDHMSDVVVGAGRNALFIDTTP